MRWEGLRQPTWSKGGCLHVLGWVQKTDIEEMSYFRVLDGPAANTASERAMEFSKGPSERAKDSDKWNQGSNQRNQVSKQLRMWNKIMLEAICCLDSAAATKRGFVGTARPGLLMDVLVRIE